MFISKNIYNLFLFSFFDCDKKVGKMLAVINVSLLSTWCWSCATTLKLHIYLSLDSSLIRSTDLVILPYQICKKNRCILHDKVYQLINPNITSSHLKRNSKLVFKKVRSRLRAKICYMESVFISIFHFISVSCNLPYNNHLVSFAIFIRFIFIRIIFRAILIYKRLSSVCQIKSIKYIIRECSSLTKTTFSILNIHKIFTFFLFQFATQEKRI